MSPAHNRTPRGFVAGGFVALASLAACSSGSVSFAPHGTPTAAPISSATPKAGASPAASPTSKASTAPSTAPTQSAAPAASPTINASGFTIVAGTAGPSKWSAFDSKMQSFMQQYGIPAAQLSIGQGGNVLYSHAYTNTTDTTYPVSLSSTIFRLSSNSKAFETAAITKLYASGAVTPSTLVWPFLGVNTPLLPSQTVDPRTAQITVQELVDHTAGYHDDTGTDPAFNMYTIEQQAGNTGPLTQDQFTRYLYGYHLDNNPGATSVYSNDGYYLLARVIEKAAGMPYLTYINTAVLSPIGVTDDVVTATAQSGRRRNEAICTDPATGFDVLTPQAQTTVPDCYGGITVYEVLDGPTSMSASADSLVKFAGHYNVYGLGGHTAGYAREGSFVGSISWMQSLNNGYDFAFTLNDRVDKNGNTFDLSPLYQYFDSAIQ